MAVKSDLLKGLKKKLISLVIFTGLENFHWKMLSPSIPVEATEYSNVLFLKCFSLMKTMFSPTFLYSCLNLVLCIKKDFSKNNLSFLNSLITAKVNINENKEIIKCGSRPKPHLHGINPVPHTEHMTEKIIYHKQCIFWI